MTDMGRQRGRDRHSEASLTKCNDRAGPDRGQQPGCSPGPPHGCQEPKDLANIPLLLQICWQEVGWEMEHLEL